jgi:hypothetical protein
MYNGAADVFSFAVLVDVICEGKQRFRRLVKLLWQFVPVLVICQLV